MWTVEERVVSEIGRCALSETSNTKTATHVLRLLFFVCSFFELPLVLVKSGPQTLPSHPLSRLMRCVLDWLRQLLKQASEWPSLFRP